MSEGKQIIEFNEFESKLIEFKEKYDDVVYDLTIPEQDKQARSDRFAIGKIVSSLDKKHAELKAPLKAQTDLIDGRRKEIKDQLLEVQGKIKGQIDAHEQAILEHAEMLQARIEEIRALAVFENFEQPDSVALSKRVESVKSIIVDNSFEDREADATFAQVQIIKELEILLANAVKQEAEQVELEKLRNEKEERERADREELIRKEASDKAKLEAEQAAQNAIDEANRREQEAIQKAEQQKKDAEQQKKDAEQAEEAAVKAEREKIQREAEAKAEKERVEKEKEDAKKSKQAYRAKIHTEAKASFIKNGLKEDDAEMVVTLIKDELIKNIMVVY